MEQQKVMNRWLVVIGAILIQLALGAIYAWSVFTPKLTEVGGSYGFSAGQAAWIFSAGLFFFALVMIWAGRKLASIGPQKLAMAGGIILGLGYILAGFFGNSFVAQLILIGIVGGSGIGLAYVVPIAVGVKWFPDKKGMLTGLAVAGFGFGATIWVKWAGAWGGGLLKDFELFGLDEVRSVFVLYGFIFAAMVLIGSLVMKDPPEGWLPKGYIPPEAGAAKASGQINFESGEMLRTPQFYMLFITFVFSALAGLMVIYCIKLFGIDSLTFSKLGSLDPSNSDFGPTKEWASAIAGTAMATYAILNGLGRIIWGIVSDKIGRRIAIFLMCLFQGIIMLFLFQLGAGTASFIIAAAIIGFNFGGNFALFPAATADFFGNKTVGKNYGLVFFAYGIAGIVGPQLAGVFKDAAKGADNPSAWWTPFIIAGIACIIGAFIILLIKAPKKV
ncbi:MAG TPA: OFA family MFS transporter [Bacteroidales bacterium]|nr:OFA family MFS transporter [Bacteroidales bacterium]HPE55463.1 OFA family MFS transporter [Bacteroidales bacterium]HRX96997.1 OFA family MFS transporter [Bacteroidales bacterium]